MDRQKTIVAKLGRMMAKIVMTKKAKIMMVRFIL